MWSIQLSVPWTAGPCSRSVECWLQTDGITTDSKNSYLLEFVCMTYLTLERHLTNYHDFFAIKYLFLIEYQLDQLIKLRSRTRSYLELVFTIFTPNSSTLTQHQELWFKHNYVHSHWRLVLRTNSRCRGESGTGNDYWWRAKMLRSCTATHRSH